MKGSNMELVHEKLEQAKILMQKYGIDTWLILTRESSDPALPLLVGVRSVHQAAIFLRSSGEHTVLASQSDSGTYKATGLFSVVKTYETSIESLFKSTWSELQIQKVALNISEGDHLCDGLTLGQYMWLEKTTGKENLQKVEVSSEDILNELRSVKSSTEIETISEAIQLTTDIFESVHRTIKPYMTEKEIGSLFVSEMKSRGVTSGLGAAYDPPLVCAVRHGLAHRKPSSRQVEPGDIVIVDFSLKHNDYVSDIARTFYFLKENEKAAPVEIEKAFQTVHEAITTSIAELIIGKKGYEVDAAGRKVIEEAGYPTIRHSVGHQIGRATHDGGTILGPKRTPARVAVEGVLREGEVYAIEPTVIQDGGLPCMLVEENVVVTDAGPKILSKRQDELWLVKA